MPPDAVSTLHAFGLGLLAGTGLVLGAALGLAIDLPHRAIAAVMSLGAGLLLAVATVELTVDAVEASGAMAAAGAIALGAAAFSGANALLRSARHRKRCGACVAQPTEAEVPGSGAAIALGTALDTLPEALVLGLALRDGTAVIALVTALALANLPEAMSSALGMRAAGRSRRYVLGLWLGVTLSSASLTALAFGALDFVGAAAAGTLQAFAAGALLSMTAETLIPEAFHSGPRFSGLLAAAGFASIALLAELLR
jgi:ZIP family zinc transporter